MEGEGGQCTGECTLRAHTKRTPHTYARPALLTLEGQTCWPVCVWQCQARTRRRSQPQSTHGTHPRRPHLPPARSRCHPPERASPLAVVPCGCPRGSNCRTPHAHIGTLCQHQSLLLRPFTTAHTPHSCGGVVSAVASVLFLPTRSIETPRLCFPPPHRFQHHHWHPPSPSAAL
jgi:hypothetical protein